MAYFERQMQEPGSYNIAPWILPAAGALGGLLFGGGKGKKQTQTTKFNYKDTNPFSPEFRQEATGLYEQQIRDLIAGGGLDFSMPEGGWGAGFTGGGASRASAGGPASQIDISDEIYNLFAPEGLRTKVSARAGETLGAQAKDTQRQMSDAATRAGLSPASGAYAAGMFDVERQKQKGLANLLRDFEIDWTGNAATRKASALDTNARLREQAMSRAAQVSMANAQLSESAAARRAAAARFGAELGFQKSSYITSLLGQAITPQYQRESEESTNSSGGNAWEGIARGASLGNWFTDFLSKMGGGGSSGFTGNPFGEGFVGPYGDDF